MGVVDWPQRRGERKDGHSPERMHDAGQGGVRDFLPTQERRGEMRERERLIFYQLKAIRSLLQQGAQAQPWKRQS